jgi:hypothetical protein
MNPAADIGGTASTTESSYISGVVIVAAGGMLAS